ARNYNGRATPSASGAVGGLRGEINGDGVPAVSAAPNNITGKCLKCQFTARLGVGDARHRLSGQQRGG
ncbi:MAG: hypothetical protein ABIO49_04190, partial [Dokdonella sp.]